MIASSFIRLKKSIQARLYGEETGYLLNYVTLQIKNEKLTNEIWVH